GRQLDALHMAGVIELIVQPVAEPHGPKLVVGHLPVAISVDARAVSAYGGAKICIRGSHVPGLLFPLRKACGYFINTEWQIVMQPPRSTGAMWCGVACCG